MISTNMARARLPPDALGGGRQLVEAPGEEEVRRLGFGRRPRRVVRDDRRLLLRRWDVSTNRGRIRAARASRRSSQPVRHRTSSAWSSDFGGTRAAMGGGARSSGASARSSDLSGRRRARCAAADCLPRSEPRLRGRPSGGARRSSALLPDDGRRRLRREADVDASAPPSRVSWAAGLFTAVVTSPPARDNIAAHDSRDRPVIAANCVTPTSPSFGSSLMARRRRADRHRSHSLDATSRAVRTPPATSARGARESLCRSRVTTVVTSRENSKNWCVVSAAALAQLWARVGRVERGMRPAAPTHETHDASARTLS